MTIETADRLVELRKENGLSQEALAARLGVSRQAISKWERAEASPDTDNLIALATLYGMTLDELLHKVNNEELPVTSANNADKKEERAARVRRQPLYPKTARNMFIFPFPVLIGLIYVAICYFTEKNGGADLWSTLWLMFLLIPVYYMFAAACRTRSKKAFLFVMPVPIIIIAIYLSLGMFLSLWGAGALVFIAVPLYYWFIAFYVKGRRKEDAEKKEQQTADEKE